MNKLENGNQSTFEERVEKTTQHMDDYWFPEMNITRLTGSNPAVLFEQAKSALEAHPRFGIELREESQVFIVKKELREDLKRKP